MNFKNKQSNIIKTLKRASKSFSPVLLLCLLLCIGANPVFSQDEIEIQTDFLVENGTNLNSGVDSELPLPYGSVPAVWRGFHSELTFDNDPNPGIPLGEWQNVKPNEVHFHYGITGTQQTVNTPFSKKYSIKYAYELSGGEYKYFKKFYYDKGHVNLETEDKIHILYSEASQKYMLYHVRGEDKTLLECETYNILETPASYISQYGRHTDDPSPNSPAKVTHRTEELLVFAWTEILTNQDSSWRTILGGLINSGIACELSSPCNANYMFLTPPPACPLTPLTACLSNPDKKMDLLEEGGINVYPNPTDGMTNIELNTPSDETINVKIVDLTGKLVQQKPFDITAGANLIQFDMAPIPAGIYHIKIDSKYQFETQKVILIK